MHALVFCLWLSTGCSSKPERTSPQLKDITESVYAPGTIKALGQYKAFGAVNGIVQRLFVKEGQLLKKNDAILAIAGDAVRLTKDDALLEQRFAQGNIWGSALKELRIQIDLAKTKMENDSLLLERQKNLWANAVGTLNNLEQREISSRNSKTAYRSLVLKYGEMERQTRFDAERAAKNLQVKSALAADYIVRSQIDGKVYDLLKEPGELVNSQSPLALIGDAQVFLMELQVDENDITRIGLGQQVLVHMNSYGQQVFEALVSKIGTVMDPGTRSFSVEALFVKQPPLLYPNLTVEANIIIQRSKHALLIPRSYLLADSFVILSNGKKRTVVTGLKDYNQVQVLSGLKVGEEILKPER